MESSLKMLHFESAVQPAQCLQNPKGLWKKLSEVEVVSVRGGELAAEGQERQGDLVFPVHPFYHLN